MRDERDDVSSRSSLDTSPRPRVRCTYCHDGLERGTAVHCAACLAPHHAECHAEHRRCAAPGCDDARVLVPDPEGRPARPSAPRDAKRPARRRAAAPRDSKRALLLVGLALLTIAGAAYAVGRRVEEPSGGRVTDAGVEPLEAAAPAVARSSVLRVFELPTRDVSLAARDFTLPVALAAGERLVVQTDARDYTNVVLEAPGRRDRTLFVAEPGDAVDVVAADERLRAGPGQTVVLEPAGDGLLRIALVDR